MIYPESEQELAAFVREGKPVYVMGSGTKRHHGPYPAEPTLCLRKLNRITSHEPGDLVVTAQAGARLADLQAELAKQGQWLPIDPPYPDATIGGILATNSSGPRRLGYGTTRDLLLGLRVIGSDGVVTKSGGRVVKNVTGFDLHKLHIGAFGTLGIITEANFKVRPRPDVSVAIVFPCDSFAEAHALLLRIHASPLRPVALEAVDRRAIVGVEGSRPLLDRHLRDLKKLGRAFEVIEGETVWDELRNPPSGFVRVRIGAKPHDLPKLLTEPCARLQAHVGNGIARIDLEPAPGLAERIRTREGYAVVESAPLDCPEREKLPWGIPGNPIMKAIRVSRDPHAILNPGRIAI